MIHKFFNENIHNKIVEVFSNNGIINMTLKEIDYEDFSHDESILVNERWNYIFGYPGSQCLVEVSVTNPMSSVQVYFCREDKFFGIQDYLKEINSHEIDDIYSKKFSEKETYSKEKYISDYLEISKKYLITHLLKVAKGEEWKEVSIDYKDLG
jgi:hypothetical protein